MVFGLGTRLYVRMRTRLENGVLRNGQQSGGAVQARRQGGFEGVRSNPPFGLQKISYAPLNCTF